MFGLTPFERKSYDLFNAFHDFEPDGLIPLHYL